MDFKWQSFGGILLDGDGDIQFATPQESLQDMVRSRLRAALDGWKLYRIGADLDRLVGNTVDTELELTIQRQVQSALTREFLPSSTFTVKTIPNGNTVEVFVYLNTQLIATQTVTL